MSWVFRLTEKQKENLQNYYYSFGCTRAEAEKLSSMAFGFPVIIDNSRTESDAWEIDCSVPDLTDKVGGMCVASALPRNTPEPAKIPVRRMKSDDRIFASWLRGGWSRTGFWEKTRTVNDEDEQLCQPEPESSILNYWNNSAVYWNYMNKNRRRIDKRLLDQCELEFEGCDDSANCIKMEKLPCTVSVVRKQECEKVKLSVIQSVSSRDSEVRHHIFMIDVSGSMGCRLVLVQLAIVALFKSIGEGDLVTIVSYADAFREIASELKAGDMDTFLNALTKLNWVGGYGKRIPAIQMAFSLLNSSGYRGTVCLLCDGYPDPGKDNGTYQKELVKRELQFGNHLNCLAFGSDSWAETRLCELVYSAGGNLLAILEPANIKRAIEENWMGSGESIFKMNIALGSEAAPSSMDRTFFMTKGAAVNKVIKVNSIYAYDNDDETEKVTISWVDTNGIAKTETMTVIVSRVE